MLSQIQSLYKSGTLPPSQLWVGEGEYVRTQAFAFAGEVLKDSTGFPLPENQAHPNFRMLTCVDGKREIAVDQVREMLPFFKNTAMVPGYRVLIIEGADALNRQAANALLKVVEEPPHQTFIIMTCATIGRVLPTLISRCARFTLRSENEDESLLTPELNQFFGKGIVAALNKNYGGMESLIAQLSDPEMEAALAALSAFRQRILRTPTDANPSAGLKKLLEIKPHSFWTDGALFCERYLLAARTAHLPVKDILYGVFLLLANPTLGYSIGIDTI